MTKNFKSHDEEAGYLAAQMIKNNHYKISDTSIVCNDSTAPDQCSNCEGKDQCNRFLNINVPNYRVIIELKKTYPEFII